MDIIDICPDCRKAWDAAQQLCPKHDYLDPSFEEEE